MCCLQQFQYWSSLGRHSATLALTYNSFYEGFLSPITHSRDGSLVRAVMEMMDTERDGRITWSNMVVRASWTWTTLHDECQATFPRAFAAMVVTRNILPAAIEYMERQRNRRHKWRARVRQLQIEAEQQQAASGNDNNGDGDGDASSMMSLLVKSLGGSKLPRKVSRLPSLKKKGGGEVLDKEDLPRPKCLCLMRLAHDVLRQVRPALTHAWVGWVGTVVTAGPCCLEKQSIAVACNQYRC